VRSSDPDGFKPGLAFDLFTVQRARSCRIKRPIKPPKRLPGQLRSRLVPIGYQIGKQTDDGMFASRHDLPTRSSASIRTALKPTNTFHVGFWFNNPKDAASCGFPADDPTQFTPFNGEHKAGPFAMISAPDPATQLGPLCTDPDPAHPGSCNP
jgi:hypothetical protein